MEETKVSKREWVKTAAIIFLAILLVLTFFSNTIMNATLPEVAAQQIEGGTINAKIRGSGTVGANETYDVTINQTRKIASVLVKVGQTVNAGDTLFLLEAQESDEVKAAQDELDQLELSYEKSLIDAGNNSAKENHEVQKARDAYNEALALYHQYSNMDSSRIATEKAKAEVALKAAQKELEKLQKELTDAKAADEYTNAQADKTKYEAKATELEATVAELEKKYRAAEEGMSVAQQIEEQNRKIADKTTQISTKSAEIDALKKGAAYQALYSLSDDVDSFMAIYVTDPEALKAAIQNQWPEKEPEKVNELCDDMIKTYNSVLVAQNELDTLQNELAVLNKELANLKTQQDAYTNKQELFNQWHAANLEYEQAKYNMSAADNIIRNYENGFKSLQVAIDGKQDEIDNQQTQVDNLTNASSAAETVKSTKQALEELVFQQNLGDSSYLDMQAAKETIEKKRKALEELTANADELEVTAKVGGVVASIEVTAGNSIGPDTPLAKLNVADRGYTIKISVTAEQAKRVKVGDKADVVNYWGGNVEAVLENIARDPNTSGNNLLVFKLTGDVDPDTNLTLSIGQKSASYDALVPNSAVRTDNNGTFVLALTSKSTPLSTRYTATRVPVQVLAQDDTMSAVSGIGAGEFVITTSTKPIEAGTQVKLADNG